MNKNQIFSYLFFLTGYSFNEQAFIELLQKRGFKVSKSQLRNWRRASPDNQGFRAVPDFVLKVLFDEIFKRKRENNNELTFPFIFPEQPLERKE